MDCVECAGLYAGAETHAAKGASLRAACYTHCSVAVLQTLVVCLVLCVAAAVAVNVCNLTVAGSNLNAEYLCDLLSRSSTADRAAVYRRTALYDCSSQTVTAREATAAAVSARQALAYQRYALVNLYGETLAATPSRIAKTIPMMNSTATA